MGLCDGLGTFTGATTQVREISMAGGGSRSDALGRAIAAALERPLIWCEGGDIGPSLGAARLGRIAAADGTIGEICTPPAITARVDPDAGLVDWMREKQIRFRALYAAVGGLWPAVS